MAQLRELWRKYAMEIVVSGVVALLVLASAYVAIPARRESALLKAEYARLGAIAASSDKWLTEFHPASTEESAIWQNTAYEAQTLGVIPADRITLAQIVASRANDAGIGDAHVKLLPGGAGHPVSPREVAGITFSPDQYGIQISGFGGIGPSSALIAALPPAVELQSIGLSLDNSSQVRMTLTLSVFESAGDNGK